MELNGMREEEEEEEEGERKIDERWIMRSCRAIFTPDTGRLSDLNRSFNDGFVSVLMRATSVGTSVEWPGVAMISFKERSCRSNQGGLGPMFLKRQESNSARAMIKGLHPYISCI